jgi:hypothetical protein
VNAVPLAVFSEHGRRVDAVVRPLDLVHVIVLCLLSWVEGFGPSVSSVSIFPAAFSEPSYVQSLLLQAYLFTVKWSACSFFPRLMPSKINAQRVRGSFDLLHFPQIR